MDPSPTLEKLQFIGFLSMCAESIKIISLCKKIFLQLTLTLILPLLVIFYSHVGISTFLITSKSSFDELGKVDEVIVSIDSCIEYWVIKASYFSFLIMFSLLSTTTVVYTVACVYSHNKTTYTMVMTFIPKVWNKLMITLLCNLPIFIAYNVIAFLTLVIFLSLYSESGVRITKMILSLIYIFDFVGFVYIIVIWQLASMISVLEESYGFQAIAKSNTLIKGKMGISASIFLEANFSLGCIHFLIEKFVVFDESFFVIGKVGFGGLFLVLHSLLFLFGLVVQTVIYFTCEYSIDTTLSSNHLDAYLCGYVPLQSRDVKFEQV